MSSRLLGFAVVLLLVATSLPARGDEVGALVKVLQDPARDTAAKGDACLKLMELGPGAAPAVPALVSLLRAKDPTLRDYAVTTLSKIGPKADAALPALRSVAARDPSAELRQLAGEAVAKIGGRAVPPAGQQEPGAVAPGADIAPPKGSTLAQGAGVPGSPVRPPLVMRQGRYFRWAAPNGWHESESTNGVDLSSPDKRLGASSTLLLRTPGRSTPRDFLLRAFAAVPGIANVRILSEKRLSDLPGTAGPWRLEELELSYTSNGLALVGDWTVGIHSYFGIYDAIAIGYQAPPAGFQAARPWLTAVAQSITITDPSHAAGNDTLIHPRNNPLDNSALMESWRQKGLSQDRISKARRQGMMGYERARDPETGTVFAMPLESYDGTVGGYRNPIHPTEILKPTQPGE